MAENIRIKRLERQALHRAAEVVNYELADPRVHLVTLTRVKLSKDLSFADIFWSVLGSDADRTKAEHALHSSAAVVQREIGDVFRTRRTPRVRFHFDESIAGAIHVGQILDELAAERAEREDDVDEDEPGSGEGNSMSNEPELRTAGPLRVAGFTTRTTNAKEMSGEGSIGGLWAQYVQWADAQATRAAPLGVYGEYESDHTGAYTLLVGHAIDDGDAPEGLTVVEVPQAEYLVFRGEGGIPACVMAAWQQVWQYFDDAAPHVRAYTVDFEQYDGTGCVDVHVSVVRR